MRPAPRLLANLSRCHTSPWPLACVHEPTSPSAPSAARVSRRREDPFATKEYMQLEFGEPADDGCVRPGLWLDCLGLACGADRAMGSVECGVQSAEGFRAPILLRPSCGGDVCSPARTRGPWRSLAAVHERTPKSPASMP